MSTHVPDSSVLPADPPRGGKVYVDSDWLPPTGTGTPTPGIVFDPARGLCWPGGEWITLPDGIEPDEAAGGLLEALALAVVDAVSAEGAVAVPGAGAVAGRVRTLLGARATSDLTGRPSVVVETTGRAEGTLEATAAVDDLGSVLLAASPALGTLSFDLYQDVHRRGLRVLGIPDPPRPAPESHLPPLAEVPTSGLRTAAPWLAVSEGG